MAAAPGTWICRLPLPRTAPARGHVGHRDPHGLLPIPSGSFWGFPGPWLSLRAKAWAAALWDLPGDWGRGLVPECPEVCGCVMEPLQVPADPRIEVWSVYSFHLGKCTTLEYSRMLVLAGYQKSVSPIAHFSTGKTAPERVKESSKVS